MALRLPLLSRARKQAVNQRGVALVTVLWLVAALAVIAFSVAATTRSDIGRTQNAIEGAKAEFLARGAIERMIFYLLNPPRPDQTPDYQSGQQRMYWRLPGGDVQVELLPESGKLNVNSAKAEQLFGVITAAGYSPELARAMTGAIIDRRGTPGGTSATDSYYSSASSSFRPGQTSFQQIEELLTVPGITPHLYHGGMERVPGGAVITRPGLHELLSVYGSTTIFDINSAPPAVLAAAGLSGSDIQMIVATRRLTPFTPQDVAGITLSTGPASRVVRAGPDQAYLIRATARPRLPDGKLSDLRLTTAALVSYEPVNRTQMLRTRAWYPMTTTDMPLPGDSRN